MEGSTSESKEKIAKVIHIPDYSSVADLTSNQDTSLSDYYEPFAERKIAHPTSDGGALAHLLKCSLGSGILAMPNAIKNGGLTLGAIGTVLIGLLCTHCVHILVKSSHMVCRKAKRPSLTFAETGEQAFATGPLPLRKYAGIARQAVNVALVATYYGGPTVYIVFIAESIFEVCTSYDVNIDKRIWILVLLLPLCCLSLIRDLKYLVPFSWMANAFIVVGFGITLYYMATEINAGDKPISDLPHVGKLVNMPLYFTTVLYAMEGIGVVMPVENSMKNPKHFLGCPGILNIAMSVVVILYAVIGFCGYVAYQGCVEASITFNLPKGDWKADAVKILVAMAIMFTYPLQFYVATDIVLTGLKNRIPKEKFGLFQNCYRVIIVTVTVGVAAAVPNLEPIISLVGAICFSSLGLILPVVIETAACYDGQLGRLNWILWKNIVVGLIAVLALVLGTYTSIVQIIDEYSGSGKSKSEDCFTNETSEISDTRFQTWPGDL